MVEDAEHRGVEADPEAEREQGNGSEAGIPPEQAHAVLQILNDGFETRQQLLPAGVLLNERPIAKLLERLEACRVRARASGDQQLRSHVDVRLQLGAQIALDA